MDPSLSVEKQAVNLLNQSVLTFIEKINTNLQNSQEIKDKCETNKKDINEYRKEINKNLKSFENVSVSINSPNLESVVDLKENSFNFTVFQNYFDSLENLYMENNEEDASMIKMKLDNFKKFKENSKNLNKLSDLKESLNVLKEKIKLIKNKLKKFKNKNISSLFANEKKKKLYQNLSGLISERMNQISDKTEKAEKLGHEIKKIITDLRTKRNFLSQKNFDLTNYSLTKIEVKFINAYPQITETIISSSEISSDILEIKSHLSKVIDSLYDLSMPLHSQLKELSLVKNELNTLNKKLLQNIEKNVSDDESKLYIDLYLCEAEYEFYGVQEQEYQKYQEELCNAINIKEKLEKKRDEDMNNILKTITNSKKENSSNISKIENEVLNINRNLNQKMKDSLRVLVEKFIEYSERISGNMSELQFTLNNNESRQTLRNLKIDFDETFGKLFLKDSEVFKV